MKIVKTDNFGGDYPNESFVNLPSTSKDKAIKLRDMINDIYCLSDYDPRYWKVVEDNYKLQPGFEP